MPMTSVAEKRTAKFGATIVGQRAADVAGGGEPEERAHAEEIAQRPAQQDREAEAPERGAGDPADVGLGQARTAARSRP